MELVHYYFIVVKFLIIIGLIAVYIGFINKAGPYYLIIDTIYKMSLGIYLIYFFRNKNAVPSLDSHDRLIFMVAGFILILTINYEETYDLIVGAENNKPECENTVHVVSKPCPSCPEKNKIHGRIMHN